MHCVASLIVVFQIKSLHLESNGQNGSKRDLNPNRDWDLPITGVEVCMGMGLPIPMGFQWDSNGNGSSFGLLMGM